MKYKFMNINLIDNKSYEKYDKVLKIILVGDTYVGKTNILAKYVDDKFENHSFTIGVDYKTSYETINNYYVKNQLWDTAGQERFRSIVKSYFKACDICILCFDSTIDIDKTYEDKSNLEGSICNIMNWIHMLEDNLDDKTLIWIVGTKIDLIDDIDKLKNNIREFTQYWRCNTNRVIKFAGWCSSKEDSFIKYDCDNIYSMNTVENGSIKDLFRMIIKTYITNKKNNYISSFNIKIDNYDEDNINNCCCIM